MSTVRSPWRWDEGHGVAAVPVSEPGWDDLAFRAQALPFGGALWTRCFWRAFGGSGKRLVLHRLSLGDRLAAVCPLSRGPGPLGAWFPVMNGHSPHWTCAVDATLPGVGSELLEHLLASAPVLDLGFLPREGVLCRALLDAARELGLDVSLDPAGSESIVDLMRPGPRLERHMQKYRQLEKLGAVEFEEVRGGPGLAAVLEECYALEAAGWKGFEGRPIRSRRDTVLFYSELTREAADRARLALYTLRLNRRLVAFELCLKGCRRIDALKISYAPDLGRHSPGNVLRALAMKKVMAEGDAETYHLGRSSEWKARWATREEPLCRLRIYRKDALGRAAYRAGPWLRRRLRDQPALNAVVRTAQAVSQGAVGRASFSARGLRSLWRRLRPGSR